MQVSVEGLIGGQDKSPYVLLHVGPAKAQLSAVDARRIALELLQVAANMEAEATMQRKPLPMAMEP